MAEKLREDAIREPGFGMVRLTWTDLRRPEVVAARVREQLRRAR
ncbi:MAG: hypothetical protein ACK5MP_01385 [Nostocoides sp.]